MHARRLRMKRRRKFGGQRRPFKRVGDHLAAVFDRLDFVTILTQGRARGYPLEGLMTGQAPLGQRRLWRRLSLMVEVYDV